MSSSYELIKKPPRRAFMPIRAHPGQYQADIAFMQYSDAPSYRKENSGHSALLLCVEVATRFAYAKILTSKTAGEVCDALAVVIDEVGDGDYPMSTLTTDDGSEFTNKQVQDLLTASGIKHYIKEPGDRYSLGIIDRLTRTLKTWIEDWQITHQSLRWIDAMPEILEKYNEHQNRTLHKSPKEMRELTAKQMKGQRRDVEEREEKAVEQFHSFHVGDRVRLRLRPGDQPRANSRLAKPGDLAKGIERWSNKVYRITAIEGFSFELIDSGGQGCARTYRAHELLKVGDNSGDVPDIFEKVASEARREKRRVREGLD